MRWFDDHGVDVRDVISERAQLAALMCTVALVLRRNFGGDGARRSSLAIVVIASRLPYVDCGVKQLVQLAGVLGVGEA